MTDGPDKVQILAQLQRIIISDDFNSSPSLQKFIKYVVHQTLDGRRDRLKGYTIGVDVFERGDDFDPQNDTIVRVQAGNLRKALAHYYLTAGVNDPVTIDLKKGGYVPSFFFVNKDETPVDANQNIAPVRSIQPQSVIKNHWSKAAAMLVIIGFSVFIIMMLLRSPIGEGDGFDRATSIPTGPSIALMPFSIVDSPENIEQNQYIRILKSGLHYELVDKISRFKNLFVKALPENATNQIVEPTELENTQFLLSGSIQPAGSSVRIISILTRTSTGEILWTETYDADLTSAGKLLEIQSDIAVDVASSLGQPDSSINNRFLAEYSSLSEIRFEHYYCLMRFYTYTNRKSPATHMETRACLENATKETPQFSSAWAALSQLYIDEELNGFNRRRADDPPRQRAMAAAERAVQTDPENAMAFQYLAIAKFWNGDFQGFRRTAEKALSLNPNDAEVLAQLGGYLIRLDNSHRGKTMVEKAIAMNPSSRPWYHGMVFPYYYIRGDNETAFFHAEKFYENGSLSAYIVYTVALVQDGQLDKAKTVYRELVQKYPYFANDYASMIKIRRPPAGMYEQLIDDLTVAGLTPVL